MTNLLTLIDILSTIKKGKNINDKLISIHFCIRKVENENFIILILTSARQNTKCL